MLHQAFIALWVVVAIINGMTALVMFGARRGAQAVRHLLFAIGCVIMIIVLQALTPLGENAQQAENEVLVEEQSTVKRATDPRPDTKQWKAERTLPTPAWDDLNSTSMEVDSPKHSAPDAAETHAEDDTSPLLASAPDETNGTPSAPVPPDDSLENGHRDGSAPPSARELGATLADTLWYMVATFSPIIAIAATFMLFFVRRKAFQYGDNQGEKALYILLAVAGTTIWLWNGFRPTPQIMADRMGLYWGVKTEDVTWEFVRSEDVDDLCIYRGQASCRVTFGRERGWLILHHFPLPPRVARYEALEFYVRREDLRHDQLLVRLYGEGKKPFPSERGIVVDEDRVTGAPEREGWERVRIPMADFGLNEGGIIGIGIGKDAGNDQGCFYLDDIALVTIGK